MGVGLHDGFFYSGDPRLKKLTHEQWAALFESKGLPGETFAYIVKGEAGYATNIQQKDPGDEMVGYGGIQATPNAWGPDSPAAKYLASLGGVAAMADPDKAADMAAYLYRAAGNSTSPWYGTKFVKGTDDHYTGTLKPEDFLGGGVSVGDGLPLTDDGSGGVGGIFGPLISGATTAAVWVGLILGGTILVIVGLGRVASTTSQPAGSVA